MIKTLSNIENKHVYISIWLHNMGWVPAGALTFNEQYGFSGFTYFESYIQKNYPPLNPATLNYRDTKTRSFVVDLNLNPDGLDRTFGELLPTSSDFAHQALISKYPQYQNMNGVQRLYFLGQRTVGGLCSYRQKQKDEISVDSLDWLDETRQEAIQFHTKELSRLYQNADAFLAMTSYGGVRPKAMYKDEAGKFWIAKFNLPYDPYDMAIAEHIAISMARDSGLKTPETKILQLPSGENVFLTERFDRDQDNRKHSLSLYTLTPGLESGYKQPKKTVATIATLLRRFSDFKDKDCLDLVVKFLLDIGLNNTDNHLRNTRILLNENNLWELSPIFDVVFNPRSQPHVYNPSGLLLEDTYLTNDALVESLSAQMGVDADEVEKKRAKVLEVTGQWEQYCNAYNMSDGDKLKIQAAINLGHSRVEIDYKVKQEQRKKLEAAIKNAERPKLSPPKPRF